MKGRRRFFADCGRAGLGLPLLSLAGCSRQPSPPPAPKAAGAGHEWDELVADLEKQRSQTATSSRIQVTTRGSRP